MELRVLVTGSSGSRESPARARPFPPRLYGTISAPLKMVNTGSLLLLRMSY